MMRRSVLATLTGLAVVVACGGGDNGGGGPAGPAGSTSIAGTYALQSVNGASPPVIVAQSGSARLEIVSGNFGLNANDTFSNTHSYRVTDAGQSVTVSETCTGTLVRNGSNVTFNEASASGTNCGGNYNGTVSGSDLTVAYSASLLVVYRR
jgi:hypothetical protein